MYVPEVFAVTDQAEARRMMREHSFALLVTAAEGAPVATHLPFLYDPEPGPHGTLLCHMAKANPQWKDFAKLDAEGHEALVIFQGPHGYISPSWYAGGPAVPTWNYVAVHVYGAPRVIDDARSVRALLDRLVGEYEAGAWTLDGQDPDYIDRMMRGIVAFEMPLTRIEGKFKLSQNRPAEDRRRVAAELAGSGRGADGALARLMTSRAAGD